MPLSDCLFVKNSPFRLFNQESMSKRGLYVSTCWNAYVSSEPNNTMNQDTFSQIIRKGIAATAPKTPFRRVKNICVSTYIHWNKQNMTAVISAACNALLKSTLVPGMNLYIMVRMMAIPTYVIAHDNPAEILSINGMVTKELIRPLP